MPTRWKKLLLVSGILNLALAGALFYLLQAPDSTNVPPPPLATPASVQSTKTNTVVRRENFTWQQIESEDYHTYVANLRHIGCPESIIRDIIIADVTALFERRKASEIVTPEQQWWRSVPDPIVIQSAAAQAEALNSERDTLLADLLGPDWQPADNDEIDPLHFPLDGPILGRLPPETRKALREIESQAYEQAHNYLTDRAAENQPPDPAELARLRRQTHAQLAEALSSAELEEYLLRYSANAHHLRSELKGVDVTPEEFKRLFREREALDQELILFAGRNDPATEKWKQELVRKKQNSIRQTLSPERYALYSFSQDPLFRQARASTELIGADPELVLPLYLIRQVTEEETQRLRQNPDLTPEQRAAALELVLTEQNNSLRKLLGDEAFERYQEYIGQ
jgi:hypothetical protein